MEVVLNWLNHYEELLHQTMAEKENYPALQNYLQGELHAVERTKAFLDGMNSTRQL